MKYTVFFFLCLVCTNLIASSINPTNVTSILVGPAYPGKAYLKIDPVPAEKADCKSDSLYTYVLDITTETGKATLSEALSASRSDKEVWLGGTGSCTIYGSVEDLAHIVIL